LITRENTFTENNATAEGGAIFVGSESIVELFRDKFKKNKAEEASALYFVDTSKEEEFSIKSCTF